MPWSGLMPDRQPSLNLSLFDTPTAPDPIERAPEYVATIRQTSTGREILVYPGSTPPAAALDLAVARKLALFNSEEIRTMAGCPDHLVEKIILAKITFPGSSVSRFIQEAAA
jgi:hypothetical protein